MAIPPPDLTVEQRAELFYQITEHNHLFLSERHSKKKPLSREDIIEIAKYIELILPQIKKSGELFPDQTGLQRALFCDAENKRVYIELEKGAALKGSYRDLQRAISYDIKDPKVYTMATLLGH